MNFLNYKFVIPLNYEVKSVTIASTFIFVKSALFCCIPLLKFTLQLLSN